ncbi:hypothetical protein VTG60DRAFT_5193 [Thermothelomyces hinnuleus]
MKHSDGLWLCLSSLLELIVFFRRLAIQEDKLCWIRTRFPFLVLARWLGVLICRGSQLSCVAKPGSTERCGPREKKKHVPKPQAAGSAAGDGGSAIAPERVPDSPRTRRVQRSVPWPKLRRTFMARTGDFSLCARFTLTLFHCFPATSTPRRWHGFPGNLCIDLRNSDMTTLRAFRIPK